MKLLALDLSSSTGYAFFEDKKLIDYGRVEVDIEDFNVNAYPDRSESYPNNIILAVLKMTNQVMSIIQKNPPDHIVIENTVRGKNRHTQRFLEFLHFCVLLELINNQIKFSYLDPSQWRSIVDLRLSDEDKKNNRDVSQGKKRGKITRKHLSIRKANGLFNLDLKMKDNDIADAMCLGWAFLSKDKV